MAKYGNFDKKTGSYSIYRPDTPAPWINYLTNENYHALVSNTGGGFSYDRSPKDSRLIRFRYNSLPIDRPGRYIYIRDKKSGHYWSPTWQPTMTTLDYYNCRHEPGSTIISSGYQKISATVQYLVPVQGDFEYWFIVLHNRDKINRSLSIFPYVELCLGHALVDLISQSNDQHFNHLRFDKKDNAIYATKRYWSVQSGVTVKQANQSWDRMLFFTSSLPVIGFDGKKDDFIGRYRSEQNPILIEKGKCSNSKVDAGDAVAVLQHDITLKPDQSIGLVVMLGVVPADNYKKHSQKIFNIYRSTEQFNREEKKIKDWYKNYFSAIHVDTPDKQMNIMLNLWNQLQGLITFRESRNASYYHGGLLYGTGFRDLAQDLLAPLISQPDYAKNAIMELCRHQFNDGSTLHNFFRLGGGGEKTNHCDTPVWLPMAIFYYLKETGDWEFLNQKIKYYDKKSGNIEEHLEKAIDYLYNQRTKRGLSKIKNGDWNDDLDYLGRKGLGESIMVTQQLAYICREAMQLYEYLGNKKKEMKYRNMYDALKKAINQYAWDGQWYIRATHDSGIAVGSKKSQQGKIYINAQSWSVISGIADNKRAISAMNSVRKYLDTPKGPKILHPAYTKIEQKGYPLFGLITRECPGKKENASIFNHTVCWAILAETILGRGDIAYDYYRKSLPMNLPPAGIDRYKMEPYVYAEYITSPDHSSFGESSHSWLTGTAAWMLRDALDYILGIRPEYNGLRIDPCIPKKWKQYKIYRRYRNVNYYFTINNPQSVSKGIKQILLDGKPYNSPLIPIFNTGESHYIKVIMG